jgi:hypothetical protein
MRTVVCETGNPPLRGDYPNVDGIWEVDSIGLIELLAGLNQGRDCNGLTLARKTSFHIGARCNPGASDLDAEIARCRAKLRAGAQFLVTRPLYELDSFRRLAGALAGEDVPVLLAIAPLRSFEEAEYLAHEVPDVIVPEATLLAMDRAGAQAARTGLELATELLRQACGLARGVVLGVAGASARAGRLWSATTDRFTSLWPHPVIGGPRSSRLAWSAPWPGGGGAGGCEPDPRRPAGRGPPARGWAPAACTASSACCGPTPSTAGWPAGSSPPRGCTAAWWPLRRR